MSYRVAAVVMLALSLAFLGAGLIHAQAAKKEEPKAEEKKDDKDEKKEEEKKEEVKALTAKEAHELMESIETQWNKLKIHARNKMGDKAAAAADEIAKLSADILRYDGNMLEAENKDKKSRDQKDFKDWVEALKKACEEYSKHAKKSSWDKADKEKDKINAACGDCHGKYEPPKKK